MKVRILSHLLETPTEVVFGSCVGVVVAGLLYVLIISLNSKVHAGELHSLPSSNRWHLTARFPAPTVSRGPLGAQLPLYQPKRTNIRRSLELVKVTVVMNDGGGDKMLVGLAGITRGGINSMMRTSPRRRNVYD